MRKGVTVTLVMDCSDDSSLTTILDLPYRCSSDDSSAQLHLDQHCVNDILARSGPSVNAAMTHAFLIGGRMGPNMRALAKMQFHGI